MKRFIAITLITVLLFSAFCLTVFADEKIKMSDDLQKASEVPDPEEEIQVVVWLNSEIKPIEQMPSWPDEVKALAEMKEIVASEVKAFYDSIPADIEYEGSALNLTPMVFLTMKLKDVYRIADLESVCSIDIANEEMIDAEPAGNDAAALKDKFKAWLYKTERIEEYDPEADEEKGGRFLDYQVLYTDDDLSLIYANLNQIEPWQQDYNLEFCGRVVPGIQGSSDDRLAYPYFVYNSQSDTFKNIYYITPNDDNYSEIKTVFEELKIGRPIGDSDGDGVLDITDATHIQRALAELCELEEESDSYWCGGSSGTKKSYSDMDGDGEVTILDATAIQRRLAGLD